jgi:hypothetical protein
MLKRFWPTSLLIAVLMTVATSPLHAADSSTYSQLIGRARAEQSLPGRRPPVATPASPGDDDMPDRTALPPRGGPLPTTNGVTGSIHDRGPSGWSLQDFWLQIREQTLRVLFRFRA